MNSNLIKTNELQDTKMKWQDPMLATLTYNFFSDPKWLYECKLDGERCLTYCDDLGNIILYSRNQIILNSTYPDLINPLKGAINSNSNLIIDGEIIALDKRGISSFSALQKRLRLKNPSLEEITNTPVYYYVFDLICLNGCDLKKLPLIERKKLLKKYITFNNQVIFSKHHMEHGIRYHSFACRKGLEGIIAKKAFSTYQNHRSKDWLKFKCANEQEFIILGYTAPKGKRIGIGALLLGYYSVSQRALIFAGKVGTGFNRETLDYLKKALLPLQTNTSPLKEKLNEKNVTWVMPKLVCQVSFTEWTTQNKLRHPRYIGLRIDKAPYEVIKENGDDNEKN
jgi:DNA ligase D-like protein (predicted ligase)